MSALPAQEHVVKDQDGQRLSLAADRLTCTVRRQFDEARHLLEEWDDLAAATGCPVTMTADWCATWWEHYGRRREPAIFEFRSAGRLIALAPMFIETLPLGPIRLRIGRIMGSDHTQSLCDLPILASWEEPVIDELARRVIDELGCELIALGPISSCSPRLAAVRSAASRRPGLLRALRDRVVAAHARIRLPETFEAYLKGLSKNERSCIRKGWNRLRREHEALVRTITEPAEAVAAFAQFQQLHAAQWRGRGKLGHFDDWPGAAAFHGQLVDRLSRQGHVRITSLVADGRCVASQYAFAFGDTHHLRLVARDLDERWKRCGLGRLLYATVIEQAIGEQARFVDAGIGRYDHKGRLGADELDVRSVVLAANRPSVHRRTEAMCRLADAIDRIYYRLWYCRIAPHVPGRRRGLRECWIRTRF